jgi:hypothetical protein
MDEARREAIRRALCVIRNAKELSLLLGVSADEVRNWAKGEGAPPAEIFLKAVDIIDGKAKPPSLQLKQSVGKRRNPGLILVPKKIPRQ